MRKQCKRKVWGLVNPITYAIEGAAVISREKQNKIAGMELTAIEAFTTGKAGLLEYRTLCEMQALAETMAKNGIGPEVIPVAAAVEAELLAVKDRFERTGRMLLTGPGIQAVRDLYQFHDLQRTSISMREYEVWITKTANRGRSMAPGVIKIS